MEQWRWLIELVIGGGFLLTIATLKSTVAKAKVEVDKSKVEVDQLKTALEKSKTEVQSNELQNTEGAIKIWRETATSLRDELVKSQENYNIVLNQLDTFSKTVEDLRGEVQKLRTTNNKIVKLLDKITPDNLSEMVEQIKNLHNETEK